MESVAQHRIPKCNHKGMEQLIFGKSKSPKFFLNFWADVTNCPYTKQMQTVVIRSNRSRQQFKKCSENEGSKGLQKSLAHQSAHSSSLFKTFGRF